MNLKQFDNPETLNIFCDASMRKHGNYSDGCYGAIAVVNNQIIDKIYRVVSDSTNNNSEIKAIRAAILLAIRHGKNLKTINIFSDSQISVFGIRDRFQTWKYDEQSNKLYGSMNQEIKHQQIYIEIMNLIQNHNLQVTFWHQKGHVKNEYKSLCKAAHVFCASNRIRDKIDISLIRYISNYNNIVDQESRSILYNTDVYKLNYHDPIVFSPISYYKLLEFYNKNNGGKL